MFEKIRLVRGDTGPQVKIAVTDETTEEVISLVGASLFMHFKAKGTTQVLESLQGFVLNGTAGIAIFEWGPLTLDVPAGNYEGEVEISFANGTRQTVYRTLPFAVREQFA